MRRSANLSVAISTLDRPEALARCLDALLGGEMLPAEVVVVDQSGNCATKDLVEQRQASTAPIQYMRQARRGLSASRNYAISHARCRVVAVTDDDCVPDPQWTSAIERTFASPTAPDALTGRILSLCTDIPGLFKVATRESTQRTEFRGKVLPWLVGGGGNFAVRRDWFLRIGGCDERLGVGSSGKAAEDMDFFYRLLRAGGSIRYEPEALIYHEPKSKSERMTRHWSYGYGIGAFSGIWLRRGDWYALRVLTHWVGTHCRDLALAIGRRQRFEAHQKRLILQGTVRGLLYGLRVPSAE